MFTLCVSYLTGRVTAARYEDGDQKLEAEWPPHPTRLFSALVAAWAVDDCSIQGKAALEWLERQPAPALSLPEITFRRRVTSFVPVNDTVLPSSFNPSGAFTAKDALSLGILPEYRSRQERCFPSALLPEGKTEVRFVWPHSDLPADHRRALEVLVKRVAYLGHSSCFVEVTVSDDEPGELTLVPDAAGTVRLRVPHPGRLHYLEDQYRRFEVNPGKFNRPNAGTTARYAPPSLPSLVPPGPALFSEMVVLRRVNGERRPITGTLQICAALRRAVMRAGPQPSPEYFSGHPPQSTPDHPVRSDLPHLGFAALAEVGHAYASGNVYGAAVLIPRDFDQQQRLTVLDAIAGVTRLNLQGTDWTVEEVVAGSDTLHTLRSRTWTHGPSGQPVRQWASVTPFVFDRHPRRFDSEHAREIVRQACSRVGLPIPQEVFCVQVSPHVGVPRSMDFPAAPARPGKLRRTHVHVILRFAEPVAGILTIGAGRFYGYGQLRPCVDPD